MYQTPMATGNRIPTSGRGLRQQTDSPEPVSDDMDQAEGPLHREHTPGEIPRLHSSTHLPLTAPWARGDGTLVLHPEQDVDVM